VRGSSDPRQPLLFLLAFDSVRSMYQRSGQGNYINPGAGRDHHVGPVYFVFAGCHMGPQFGFLKNLVAPVPRILIDRTYAWPGHGRGVRESWSSASVWP
jgi:hypothetical protein